MLTAITTTLTSNHGFPLDKEAIVAQSFREVTVEEIDEKTWLDFHSSRCRATNSLDTTTNWQQSQ